MAGKTTMADWNGVALNDRRPILGFDGDMAQKASAARAISRHAGNVIMNEVAPARAQKERAGANVPSTKEQAKGNSRR